MSAMAIDFLVSTTSVNCVFRLTYNRACNSKELTFSAIINLNSRNRVVSAIDIDQEETMELNICGRKAGKFASTVKCHVNYSIEPIYVHVIANFEVVI